jgi:O-antigen ligase/cytochrome c-type biogenesis protein CcmH/NrfG
MDLYMLCAAFIVYALFSWAITSSRQRVAFVVVLFVLAVGNVLIGVIQFFKGHDFMPIKALPRGEYGFRASGLYGCPNHLAGFLEVVMLFALSIAWWSRWRVILRIVAAYIAVVCGVGIVITGSRGGYASSLFGVLVFSVISLLVARRSLRRDRWYLVIAGGTLLVLALTVSIRSIFRDSQLLQFRVESASIDAPVRLGMWKAAVRQFQLSPVFGTGSGTYLLYGRQFRDPGHQRDPNYAHSDCLQLLAEFGIVGIAAVLLFTGAHLWSGWHSIAGVIAKRAAERPSPEAPRHRARKRMSSAWRAVAGDEKVQQEQVKPTFKGSHNLALTIAALSSVAAISVHSIVDFNLHIPANTLVMAFVFALLGNPLGTYAIHSTNGVKSQPNWASWFGLTIPGVGILMAVTALPNWPAEYYCDKARRVLSHHEGMASPDLVHDAERFSAEAVRRDPKNTEGYYYLGESAVALAELSSDATQRDSLYERSVEAYQKALELMPQDVRLVLCLAWSLDTLNRFAEAEPVLRRAMELDPNSIKVWNSYADHLRREGVASPDEAVYKRRFDEAKAMYKHSLELAPQPTADYGLRQLEKDREAKERERMQPSSQSSADSTRRDE